MSNFHEKISLQAKMIRNRMNVSVQPQQSITIPVSNLEAAIRPRVQKENVKNVSITVDSQGPQFQPEGSLTIPIKDLEATMRTSLQRNNSTLVEEITEAGEGSETKADNLECVSLRKRIQLFSIKLEEKRKATIRAPLYSLKKMSDLFQPRAISIGPVHSRLMEDTKWAFLDALSDSEIVDCIKRIKNLEKLARGCYQSKIKLSSEEFVQILFVDSIFIISLLTDDANQVKDSNKVNDSNEVNDWDSKTFSKKLSYFFDDLLLLENQIPFFILQEMWDAVFREARKKDFPTILQGTRFGRDGFSKCLVLGDTCHLLDLYCKWVLPIPARVSNYQGLNCFLLRKQSWFRSWFSQPQAESLDVLIPRPQSVTELYEAGVKFKPKKEFKNFLDISFENGILEIPTLTFNSSFMSRLANVLLHEITNAVSQELYVSSYVFFMDSLIRTKNDIVLLKKFGVLDNKLASDDEAVNFIKSLGECIGIVPVDARVNNCYTFMILDMMEYAASSWRRNWTSLKLTYFSNLWKGISVIAGSSLLIIGFVQTYYSAYPYYHHYN